MPEENSKTITTTDTRTLIVEQFGRAGPWALLAVLVLGGVGYEMDYFLKRYVQQSEDTMTMLRKNTEQLTEAFYTNLEASTSLQSAVAAAHETILSNAKLLAEGNSQHTTLVKLMEQAGEEMQPVSDERKRQTELLQAIKEAVEKNRQMEMQQDNGPKPTDLRIEITFRQLKLPRSIRVAYPRPTTEISNDWKNRSCLLVAEVLKGEVVGYASMMLTIAPHTNWMTDLVVMRRLRRQGIGSTLVLAGQDWARHRKCDRMVLEMQPKNYPAICMVQKLGYDLCGYNDHYFPNHDIALFFSKTIR